MKGDFGNKMGGFKVFLALALEVFCLITKSNYNQTSNLSTLVKDNTCLKLMICYKSMVIDSMMLWKALIHTVCSGVKTSLFASDLFCVVPQETPKYMHEHTNITVR